MSTCNNCGKTLKKKMHNGCKHVFCNLQCRDEYRNKQIPFFGCSCCGKQIQRRKKGEHIFCNLQCRDTFKLRKYDYLYNLFLKNPNEVAYLFGLLMGDGHFKKVANKTTRLCIAFNSSDVNGHQVAETVLKKLRIQYFIEPKIHANCMKIGFMLPDNLLNDYGLLFSGNKYSIQPKCPKHIVNNINFALGLLNSDGHYRQSRQISFVNTVQSIISNFEECLGTNNIDFKQYERTHKNQPTWRKVITVAIMRKKSMQKILEQTYCKWKS